jgi:hypothetical protein
MAVGKIENLEVFLRFLLKNHHFDSVEMNGFFPFPQLAA